VESSPWLGRRCLEEFEWHETFGYDTDPLVELADRHPPGRSFRREDLAHRQSDVVRVGTIELIALHHLDSFRRRRVIGVARRCGDETPTAGEVGLEITRFYERDLDVERFDLVGE
jgi:hypothetical protein